MGEGLPPEPWIGKKKPGHETDHLLDDWSLYQSMYMGSRKQLYWFSTRASFHPILPLKNEILQLLPMTLSSFQLVRHPQLAHLQF